MIFFFYVLFIFSKTAISKYEVGLNIIENISLNEKFLFDRDAEKEGEPTLYALTVREKQIETELNLTIVPVNIKIKLILFGRELSGEQIVFTNQKANRGEKCEILKTSEEYNITEYADDIYSVEAKFKEPDVLYFICLHKESENIWIHQGMDEWLTVKTDKRQLHFLISTLLIVLLLLLSALLSGLNLGLMILDKHDLQVLINCGTIKEKRNASAVKPVRERGNFLLISLLIGNSLVNSGLTVLLDNLLSDIETTILSTISIFIIGELLPQSLCSRHGLMIGAKTVYITYLIMAITSPISYPISKIFDYILGDEVGHVYDRDSLKEYIKLTKGANRLEEDEMNIILGALEFHRKTVGEIMTPLDEVYMISISEKLDSETFSEIIRRGYSRIPVYNKDKSDVVGLITLKDIMLYDPDDAMPIDVIVKSTKYNLIYIHYKERIKTLLQKLKEAKCHLAFVIKSSQEEDESKGKIIGVVTMEDVVEEIIQTEIIDETDIVVDKEKRLTRKAVKNKNVFDFLKIGEGRSATYFEISPQMLDATFQFLSTYVKPFAERYISAAVLKRLLDQKIYHEIQFQEDGLFKGKTREMIEPLYSYGVACDYFIMILEGKMSAIVGIEGKIFECKPFCFFGESALALSNYDFYLLRNETNETRIGRILGSCFIPDYTVKIVDDCLYLKITRKMYLTACKASANESKFSKAKSEYTA
ncbi:metal transporter CNNM4-like protein [Dinothrombium tinctorium]|uniref:Metal transporter CNNM4-like protein n=1 Tax=Dinothrombium tinctorium TaxID=1965070 RepID=A0A3S3QXS9_9ACAR|nr:metal transporter CNNM4-like protein [Dinothrombium tinctorium]RWS15632.1 metal transporter CNNM4-like protein [Dinothrombium tinctorium]RWS15644.1 metal transporter CNNM4-like protein [Dinothrombium tinctorium]